MKNENDENHAQLLLTPKAYSRHFAIHSRSKRGSDLGKGKVSAKPKCNPKRPTSTFANGTFASPYAFSIWQYPYAFDRANSIPFVVCRFFFPLPAVGQGLLLGWYVLYVFISSL